MWKPYAIYARVNYSRMYPQDSYRGGDVITIRHNQCCANCVDYQRFTQQISRVPPKASLFFANQQINKVDCVKGWSIKAGTDVVLIASCLRLSFSFFTFHFRSQTITIYTWNDHKRSITIISNSAYLIISSSNNTYYLFFKEYQYSIL